MQTFTACHYLRNRRALCRNARVWGVAEAGAGKKPEVVTARLSGHRDPGYWETSRMLLESALCLALQVQPAVALTAHIYGSSGL